MTCPWPCLPGECSGQKQQPGVGSASRLQLPEAQASQSHVCLCPPPPPAAGRHPGIGSLGPSCFPFGNPPGKCSDFKASVLTCSGCSTKRPQTGCLQEQTPVSHHLGGWTWEVRVPAWLGPDEVSLPGLLCHCSRQSESKSERERENAGVSSSSYKGTTPFKGPHPRPHLNLLTSQIPSKCHTLGVRAAM